MSKARSLARKILRELHRTHFSVAEGEIPKTAVTLGSAPRDLSLWTEHAISEFRKNANESDPKRIKVLLQRAEDHVALFEQLREKERLRKLDTGEYWDNEQDKIKATAGRVGLQVPKVSLD